jgi:UBX domain
LAAGLSKDEFFRRINLALGSTSAVQAAPIQAAPPAAILSHTPQRPASPQPPRPQPSTSSSNAPPTRASAPTPARTPSESRDKETADEKKARLEAQKKALQAKDEARRAAEIRARRDEIEGVASKSTADKKYAMMQKKRAQDARDERARILKRVEDDKAERRERETQRKAEAKALAEGVPLPAGSSSSPQQAKSTNSPECALQIRLFDGSTIRNRFPSSATLRRDVRPWIDEKQTGDQPYNFKQVLTPLPNKNIEASEEEETLQSLGLTPNATLILVPIAAYSSAYEGGTGLVSRGVSAGYGLVSSGLGMVTGLLGGILGGGTAPLTEEHRQTPTTTSTQNPSINVRTLRDQQSPRDDTQFYNGNAVSKSRYSLEFG